MQDPTTAPQLGVPFDPKRHLPAPELIQAQVRAALDEDVGTGDLTAALLPEEQRARAEILTREDAVLAGRAWLETVFTTLDPRIGIHWDAADGDRVAAGQRLCVLEGRARALLTGERTAMNYLQALSGTATRARRYADAVAGLPVQVLDTRKTLPGLRVQQKYAVLCGGCHNHRQGLFDAILIKENHILAAGSIAAALEAARAVVRRELGQAEPSRDIPVEIEVESVAEMQAAIQAGAACILLDNFPLEDLRHAVSANAGRACLEASGGVTLEAIRAIAETGVDRISVGDLTKDLTAVDLSMRFVAL